MDAEEGNKFRMMAEAPLAGLLFKFSWPALVSMTLNALYAIVDRIYIGHGCGQDAMAGITLAFPVMMLMGAVGVFTGVGHSSLISIKAGEKNYEACERLLGELVAFKLLFFLLLPPAIYVYAEEILRLSGGAGVTAGALAEAKKYLQLVIFSHLFSHLAFGLSAAMRSEGAVVQSMTCMVVGFGVNLALDPLFIFGFGMGVAGAAWATNAAMACSCAWALWHYRPGNSLVRLRICRIGFYREFVLRAAGIGVSPAVQQLLGGLINMAMQLAFAKWAADRGTATQQIASLGIFQMVMMLFLLPVLGVQQGIGPIIGYNWGARNYRRVRETVVIGFWATTGIVAFSAALQVFAPWPIARMFTDGADAGFLRMVAHDLRVSNCMLWCIGLNITATTYFQAIGHPWTATYLSLLRQLLCLLPGVWFLPYLFPGNPTLGVWLALPISDVLAFAATIPPMWSHVKFLGKAGAIKRKGRGARDGG